jgi:hypothetical protein
MNHHWIGLLVLSAAAAAACSFEPVDGGASGGDGGNAGASTLLPAAPVSADNPDSSWALCGSPSCDNANGTIPLLTDFPPIYLPDGGETTNPCTEIESESMAIRQNDCAVCHSGTSPVGGYNFILDDAMLVSSNVNGVSYVAAGDPAASLVYQKASAGLDPTSVAGMPPMGITPRPSVSDVSVLYQWIMCLGGDAGAGTTVSYGGDGGVVGAGTGDATADSASPLPDATLPPDSGSPIGTDAAVADAAVPEAAAPDVANPNPTNLITNGNFAEGTAKWAIVTGTATESIVGGELCVAVAAAEETATIVLGWPEPAGSTGVPLSATGSYTFSYTARATKADVTVDATVGNSVGPTYLPLDFVSKTDPVTTVATTFTHPFTPASGADPSAGLSFSFVSNVAQSVCFANVSLVLN